MHTDRNGKNRVITLLRKQDLSRVELANKTGLVKSALTKITQQLIQDGLIHEFEQSDTNGKHGRPITRLKLTRGVNFSVSIYISIEGLSAFLIDQTNHIYKQHKETWDAVFTFDGLFSADLLIQKLTSIIKQLKSDCSIHTLKIVTIATQGKVAQHTGYIHQSQILKEDNVDFANLLSEEIDTPVQLYNIAYCSTFQLTQKSPNIQNFVGLYLGYGFGVGVNINQRIILGQDGVAPEVSHLTYEYGGKPCHCGAQGCAENYVTYQAIFNELELAGIPLPEISVVDKINYIHTLIQQDNIICINIINRVVKVIAHTIIQLTNLFDVNTVILNGETALLFPFLRNKIEENIRLHNSNKPTIQFIHESDNDIAFAGLIELTNLAYQI